MNRLTKRNQQGVAYMAISETLAKWEQEIEGSQAILEGVYAIFQRLADYEDTGLESEEIKGLGKWIDELRKELKEYKGIEEQGLLIKLPCKVGDTVYEANISRNIISTYKITAIVIGRGSINYNWGLLDGVYSNINGFNKFALGKKVFLTREEAEKELEVPNAKA